MTSIEQSIQRAHFIYPDERVEDTVAAVFTEYNRTPTIPPPEKRREATGKLERSIRGVIATGLLGLQLLRPQPVEAQIIPVDPTPSEPPIEQIDPAGSDEATEPRTLVDDGESMILIMSGEHVGATPVFEEIDVSTIAPDSPLGRHLQPLNPLELSAENANETLLTCNASIQEDLKLIEDQGVVRWPARPVVAGTSQPPINAVGVTCVDNDGPYLDDNQYLFPMDRIGSFYLMHAPGTQPTPLSRAKLSVGMQIQLDPEWQQHEDLDEFQAIVVLRNSAGKVVSTLGVRQLNPGSVYYVSYGKFTWQDPNGNDTIYAQVVGNQGFVDRVHVKAEEPNTFLPNIETAYDCNTAPFINPGIKGPHETFADVAKRLMINESDIVDRNGNDFCYDANATYAVKTRKNGERVILNLNIGRQDLNNDLASTGALVAPANTLSPSILNALKNLGLAREIGSIAWGSIASPVIRFAPAVAGIVGVFTGTWNHLVELQGVENISFPDIQDFTDQASGTRAAIEVFMPTSVDPYEYTKDKRTMILTMRQYTEAMNKAGTAEDNDVWRTIREEIIQSVLFNRGSANPLEEIDHGYALVEAPEGINISDFDALHVFETDGMEQMAYFNTAVYELIQTGKLQTFPDGSTQIYDLAGKEKEMEDLLRELFGESNEPEEWPIIPKPGDDVRYLIDQYPDSCQPLDKASARELVRAAALGHNTPVSPDGSVDLVFRQVVHAWSFEGQSPIDEHPQDIILEGDCSGDHGDICSVTSIGLNGQVWEDGNMYKDKTITATHQCIVAPGETGDWNQRPDLSSCNDTGGEHGHCDLPSSCPFVTSTFSANSYHGWALLWGIHPQTSYVFNEIGDRIKTASYYHGEDGFMSIGGDPNKLDDCYFGEEGDTCQVLAHNPLYDQDGNFEGVTRTASGVMECRVDEDDNNNYYWWPHETDEDLQKGTLKRHDVGQFSE